MRHTKRRNPYIPEMFKKHTMARRTAYCEVCNQVTQSGKRYCSEHIEQSDYIRKLQEKLTAYEDEPAQVIKFGLSSICPRSLVLQDILLLLREYGPTSTVELLKHFDLDLNTLRVYANYLVSKRLARWVVIDMKKGPVSHLMLGAGDSDRNIRSTEVAALYDVDAKVVHEWVKDGAPHTSVKNKLYFNAEELEAWLAERQRVKEASQRDLDRGQVAKHYGVRPHTVLSWIKQGAPHRRATANRLIFTLAELDAWKASHRKEVRRKFRQARKRLRGKINVKNFDEPLWKDLEADYFAGMRLQHLREKYHVGLQRIMRYIKERGLSRETTRGLKPRTAFHEPFWEQVAQDYLDGMAILKICAKYHIDKLTLDRFLKLKNLTRTSLHFKAFEEPFWTDVERDYLDGKALRTIRDRHHISEERLKRFIRERGLPSRDQGGFPEDFWAQLLADRKEGMSLENLQKKYRVGKKRVKAYLEQQQTASRRTNPFVMGAGGYAEDI